MAECKHGCFPEEDQAPNHLLPVYPQLPPQGVLAPLSKGRSPLPQDLHRLIPCASGGQGTPLSWWVPLGA